MDSFFLSGHKGCRQAHKPHINMTADQWCCDQSGGIVDVLAGFTGRRRRIWVRDDWKTTHPLAALMSVFDGEVLVLESAELTEWSQNRWPQFFWWPELYHEIQYKSFCLCCVSFCVWSKWRLLCCSCFKMLLLLEIIDLNYILQNCIVITYKNAKWTTYEVIKFLEIGAKINKTHY